MGEHITEIATLHLLLLTSSCSQDNWGEFPEDSSLRSCVFCVHSMPSASLDPLNEAHNIMAGSRMHTTQSGKWCPLGLELDWGTWFSAVVLSPMCVSPRGCTFPSGTGEPGFEKPSSSDGWDRKG